MEGTENTETLEKPVTNKLLRKNCSVPRPNQYLGFHQEIYTRLGLGFLRVGAGRRGKESGTGSRVRELEISCEGVYIGRVCVKI